MKYFFPFFCILICLSICRGTAQGAWQIPLEINVPGQKSIGDYIVVSTVPFPNRFLKNTENLAIIDPAGRRLPCQFTVLSRWWPYNSEFIAWLQVIFQAPADLSINGNVYLAQMTDVSKEKPSFRVIVDGKPEIISVSNGIVKLNVNQRTGAIEKIWFDRDQNQEFSQDEICLHEEKNDGFFVNNPSFTDKIEKKPLSHFDIGQCTKVALEESGSLKSTIKISGYYVVDGIKNILSYTVRISIYAAQPFIHIEHILKNSSPQTQIPEKIYWDSCGYKISTNWKKGVTVRYLKNSEWGKIFLGPSDSWKVYQDSPGGKRWNRELYDINRKEAYHFRGFKINKNDEPYETGDYFKGLVSFDGQNSAVLLEAPYFWALAPKMISCNGGKTIRLELWPEDFSKSHHMGPDVQKAHDFYLSFHRTEVSKEQITIPSMALNRAWPRNNWIVKSGAWEEFGAINSKSHRTNSAIDEYFKRSEKLGQLGVWNFGGDVWEHNGGNFEPPTHFFQNFIVVRNRDTFEIARLNAEHWRDLRNYHFGVDWETLTLNNSYDQIQKFYHQRVKEKKKSRWPAMDIEHTTAKDQVLYYYLTGDKTTTEGLGEQSEWIKWMMGHQKHYINKYSTLKYPGMIETNWTKKQKGRWIGWGSARTLGWQMRELMMIYRALGDSDDLEFARFLAYNHALGNQDLYIGIYGGETIGETKPWMEAIVGVGLAHVFQTTREEDILDSLIGLGGWLSDSRLCNLGRTPYKWKFGEVNKGKGSSSSNRIPGILAWLYKETGIKRFLDVATDQAKALGWQSNKKPPIGSLGFELFWQVSDPSFLSHRDKVAPAAIKDLKANLFKNDVYLFWTAPGDDNNIGKASAYQIKYAEKKIVENVDVKWNDLISWDGKTFLSYPEINFWAAQNIKEEPRPSESGKQESFKINGIKKGTYYFAIKTWDDGPNISELSNVVKVWVP